MINQQKNESKVENIKLIHDIHKSGEISSFLRDLRENRHQIENFSNTIFGKLKENRQKSAQLLKIKEEEAIRQQELERVKQQEEVKKVQEKQIVEEKPPVQEQPKQETQPKQEKVELSEQAKQVLAQAQILQEKNSREGENSPIQNKNSQNSQVSSNPNGNIKKSFEDRNQRDGQGMYQRNNGNFQKGNYQGSSYQNRSFNNGSNNNSRPNTFQKGGNSYQNQGGYQQRTFNNNNQNPRYQGNNYNNNQGYNRNPNYNNNGYNNANGGYNNNNGYNNNGGFNNRGISSNNKGQNPRYQGNNYQNGYQKNFNNNGQNSFQRPFGNRNGQNPRFNNGMKSEFTSTKENSFKSFAPNKDNQPFITQQERNFANKNKSSTRNLDEKKQNFKRNNQRRGYIDLDDDGEERVTIRKLAKAKKKENTFIAPSVTSAVITTENISVKSLSEKIGKPVPVIIKQLMLLGVMATINSSIDYSTAELIANELGIKLEQKIEKTFEEKMIEGSVFEDEDKDAVKRPPVVAVMGHVDHGKTSLLDTIRKTNIASGEAGGITQKIGAYSITVNGEKITFIDTPGHAAFTSMRARGAKITDIAILVVAADDGVMPQTIEAINHIKAANVPMIVAINKMDAVNANPERIKTQLAENGVMPEDWGGDAVIVPVSARTGVGIDNLINMILLVADMANLKANPKKMAVGTVIEAELDKNRGPIATVLVENGTLRVGDSIMSGITFGKVKAMYNENGKVIKEATPSTAVSVMGFYEVPFSGDQVFAVSEKLSKQVIQERINKIKEEKQTQNSGATLDDFMDRVKEGLLKSLNIIIKADVQGSVEALKQSLTAIRNDEVKVVCIHSGVGAVTESDIVLAKASSAVIINFNLKVNSKVENIAEHTGVQIKNYKIIYEVVEEITDAINGMLTVKYEQVTCGHAEVRQVFKLSSYGTIAGSYVTDGKIVRSGMARLFRDGELIIDTKISALKIFKDDKSEVASGFECGIKLEEVPSMSEGDIIECYENVPIKRS